MSNDIVVKLGEALQRALKHPDMFMGPPSVAACNGFLGGIWCVYYVLSMKPTSEILNQAAESHGWSYTSTRGVDLMREQGLTEEQIVHQLLLIEITKLELMAQAAEKLDKAPV